MEDWIWTVRTIGEVTTLIAKCAAKECAAQGKKALKRLREF